MKHNLEFLANLVYDIGLPQFVPKLFAKDKSTLDYKIYASNVRIRATRECTIRMHLKRPARITVLGGYQNKYLLFGDEEVLKKSTIVYLAGCGNSVPDNIGKVVTKGGVFY